MEAAEQFINKQFEDPFTAEIMLINICTRDAVVAFPAMKAKYNIGYHEYAPEPGALNDLRLLIKDKKITIVLGTWCGDSQQQLPHFLKIADTFAIPEKDMIFICVDRTKEADSGLIDHLNIDRVPTFIIYNKEEEELGRIIEKPIISLEEDLVFKLSKK